MMDLTVFVYRTLRAVLALTGLAVLIGTYTGFFMPVYSCHMSELPEHIQATCDIWEENSR